MPAGSARPPTTCGARLACSCSRLHCARPWGRRRGPCSWPALPAASGSSPCRWSRSLFAPICAAAGAGHRPIRIDYILSTGRPLHADLALTDTGRGFSYSDHLGVAATLELGGGSGISSSNCSCGCGCGSCKAADGGKQRGKQQQEQLPQGQQAQGQLAPPSAALQLMRAYPEPFHEAAAQIEEAAGVMSRGRRHAISFAASLFAAGFGCLGALAARPWREAAGRGLQPGDHYLLLLGGMGAALGWAGASWAGPCRHLWALLGAVMCFVCVLTTKAALHLCACCRRCACRRLCGARAGAAGAAAGGPAAAHGGRLRGVQALQLSVRIRRQEQCALPSNSTACRTSEPEVDAMRALCRLHAKCI